MKYLGIDTSNYTTSLAVFNSETKELFTQKKMLDAGTGLGLRQSEAHFNHTKNLPSLFESIEKGPYGAVGVSSRPRNVDGSYMPCFLSGVSAAGAAAASSSAPLHLFSHQEGHVAAAIFGAGREDLFEKGKSFYAFHLSGGTTELLKVTSNGAGFLVEIISETHDISAGQALDRTGNLLGFSFPSGKEIDRLSFESNKNAHLRCYKNGGFNFSGLENKVRKMIEDGESFADTARYAMVSVANAVKAAIEDKTDGTVIMSGGVTSSRLLREALSDKKEIYFAPAELSADNAAGIAILTSLKEKI